MPSSPKPIPSPMITSSSTATLRQPGLSTPTVGRPRGLSTSSLQASMSKFAGGLSPPTNFSPLGLIDEDNDSSPASSFLTRTRSKSQYSPAMFYSPRLAGQSVEQDSPVPTSWWRFEREPPKRQSTIPVEQTDSWAHTRKASFRVSAAAARVLGASLPAAHEALRLTSEFLDAVPVPIPGLQQAAKILLTIWDSVQGVDINRMACLRLTERCAEILLSVRQEVEDAGAEVVAELKTPIEKLVEAFTKVQTFMLKQAHRPFLKRYLRREEIIRDIGGCDKGLTDALSMFGFSIQIRILKQVEAAEHNRQADARALLDAVVRSQQHMPPVPSNTLQGLGITFPKDTPGLPPSSSHKSLSNEGAIHPDAVLPALQSLHHAQNAIDLAQDTADLRALMHDAVGQSSDAEMIRVLQVGRDEYPEALKTLQRALERVSAMSNASPSMPEITALPTNLAPESIERSISASSSGSSAIGLNSNVGRDVLDREFIESGIDALRRLSKGSDMGLPSWTITRYEVDRDVRIGIGFFSNVYRGRWRNRVVAIKILAECTPQELFVKEVAIWKEFKHPNVLELYGASAVNGDGPYFFVCPYEKYGCLSEFLRKLAHHQSEGSNVRSRHASLPEGSPGGSVIRPSIRSKHVSANMNMFALLAGQDTDLLRFMHEIGRGMEYLHDKGVLHGDLKAANILVDDHIHCLVADFGQSEMKSEVFRISGTSPPTRKYYGTLRWQAPELMLGHGQMTTAMDVYSFAMCCVEILTMGKMPWPFANDEDVRHLVLKEHSRPVIPPSRYNTAGLQNLLQLCWDQDPSVRPDFSRIVQDLKLLRKHFRGPTPSRDIPSPRFRQKIDEDDVYISRPSPDMHPMAFPGEPQPYRTLGSLSGTLPLNGLSSYFQPIQEASLSAEGSASDASSDSLIQTSLSFQEDTVATPRTHMTQVVFTPSKRPSTLHPTSATQPNPSDEDLSNLLLINRDGNASPPPVDERRAKFRNERRYRLLLSHEFHPSLTLPLWKPSPISVGAVGYLSKPEGTFVTILNCFSPDKSAEGDLRGLPSIHGYGKVAVGGHRQDKRNAAKRGFDAIAGLLTFKRGSEGSSVSQSVSRRYSYPLRSGHKTAYLCTETTMYRYIEKLDAPKKWFKANVDSIMETYGPMHNIQKEDLFLVIGTLSAPDYALFVSHRHSDGQAHFNVFSSSKPGQLWGTFTTDTGSELGGPSYHEPVIDNPQSASKVSSTSSSTGNHTWDTVLVARLRFKPDATEPTSL
ncbi:Protein kinase domain-containing protein [Mycena indigotica]|uniref:Protein kinase domain-containing protein n=1 Tax=Mycena indigotica TaxID=2126181 RepID=A0A8H6TGP7_9AGAR|nr:Protein kinase domain-containing protein [Mycena indigotica]KAF7315430.1 Protein kinase domain-containing protein [Mycena indigotica]